MNREATVVVVDDDPGALDSTRWLLESEGLPVETYASGADFLRAYDPERPGCLLLDLKMPEMDGLELQRRLAAGGAHPPIIFVSGQGDVPKCKAAMKAGAVDFLEKPADDVQILTVVRTALEIDRQRRAVAASDSQMAARLAHLTPRELQTLRCLLAGEAIKQIAARFRIGFQTAAKHRARVLGKMGVGNEVELIRLLKEYPLEEVCRG